MIQFIGSDRIHLEPDFLPNTSLKFLKSINFSCPEFSLDSFSRFLRRHASTLVEMHLIGATAILSDDGMPSVLTWDDIFQQLRREVNLQVVSVRGTFRHQGGSSIVFIHEDDPRHKSVPPEVWDVPSKAIEMYLLEGGQYPELPWDKGMPSLSDDDDFEMHIVDGVPMAMYDDSDHLD